MSDLEDLARAANERRLPPAGLQRLAERLPDHPVPYARPMVRPGILRQYRARVGFRSWVAQMVLAGWTALMVLVGGSLSLMTAVAPARASDTMPGVAGTAYDFEINDAGNIRFRHVEAAIELGIFSAVVWGVIALPLGITAIVTLERK